MFAAFPVIIVRRCNQKLIYSGGVLVLNLVEKGLLSLPRALGRKEVIR